LKCRTVGLCMAHNRLCNFHVVRSTRPVQYMPSSFVPGRDSRTARDDAHKRDNEDYPDPDYYLNYTQKYFFRNAELLHLRAEQFNRYFSLCGDSERSVTLDDTCEDDEDIVVPDLNHRHYDEEAEDVPPGTVFPGAVRHVNGARRRKQARLGVARAPFIEPLGAKREDFYEQRLLLSLPWHCPEPPKRLEDGSAEWRFVWHPSGEEALGGAILDPLELRVAPQLAVSYEQTCADVEREICRYGDLVCTCCALEAQDSCCSSCRFAVGFHRCANRPHLVWRKGTLHGGALDIQRVLFNLHRKGLPTDTLRDKAALYVRLKMLTEEAGQWIIQNIEQERSIQRMANEIPLEADGGGSASSIGLSARLTQEQLEAELRKREADLQRGCGDGITDQWRVYQHIVGVIASGRSYLRLMVQASAGTGKSYLLATVAVLIVFEIYSNSI
jgi:hypothetical protein